MNLRGSFRLSRSSGVEGRRSVNAKEQPCINCSTDLFSWFNFISLSAWNALTFCVHERKAKYFFVLSSPLQKRGKSTNIILVLLFNPKTVIRRKLIVSAFISKVFLQSTSPSHNLIAQLQFSRLLIVFRHSYKRLQTSCDSKWRMWSEEWAVYTATFKMCFPKQQMPRVLYCN